MQTQSESDPKYIIQTIEELLISISDTKVEEVDVYEFFSHIRQLGLIDIDTFAVCHNKNLIKSYYALLEVAYRLTSYSFSRYYQPDLFTFNLLAELLELVAEILLLRFPDLNHISSGEIELVASLFSSTMLLLTAAEGTLEANSAKAYAALGQLLGCLPGVGNVLPDETGAPIAATILPTYYHLVTLYCDILLGESGNIATKRTQLVNIRKELLDYLQFPSPYTTLNLSSQLLLAQANFFLADVLYRAGEVGAAREFAITANTYYGLVSICKFPYTIQDEICIQRLKILLGKL